MAPPFVKDASLLALRELGALSQKAKSAKRAVAEKAEIVADRSCSRNEADDMYESSSRARRTNPMRLILRKKNSDLKDAMADLQKAQQKHAKLKSEVNHLATSVAQMMSVELITINDARILTDVVCSKFTINDAPVSPAAEEIIAMLTQSEIPFVSDSNE